MKTSTAIVWGLVALIAIGAISFLAIRNPNTSTVVVQTQPTSTDTETPTVTPSAQPGAPAVVTSQNTNPTDTTVVVTGNIVPNGVATSYWYEYGTTLDLGSKTAKESIGSGYRSIGAPYFISGLNSNTTYYFRLSAENSYGIISGAKYSFQTTQGTPAPVGSAPAAQTSSANGITREGAVLNGQVTANKAATTYWFEYGKTPDLGEVSPLVGVAYTSVGISASLPVIGLDPLTTYYFRINAQNLFGTVNGKTLTFKTIGPAQASAPTVTTRGAASISTSTVTLRGTVNPNGATTAYWFEYSTNSDFSSPVMNTPNTSMASAGGSTVSIDANVIGLSNNTTYYFRTVAQNSQGTVRGSTTSFKTR